MNKLCTNESNGVFVLVKGKRTRFAVHLRDFLGFGAMHRSFIENYRSQKTWEPHWQRIRTELPLIEAAYKSLKTKRFEPIVEY